MHRVNNFSKRVKCCLTLDILEDRLMFATDMVIRWNDVLLDTIRTAKSAPPIASRSMAIVQVSVYDAVNSIDQTHTPYLIDYQAPPHVSKEAATAQAAYTALVGLFPSQQSTFDAQLSQSLAEIPDGDSKTIGIQLGQAVAERILAVRAQDGWNKRYPYTPGNEPGDWQPTPPAYLPALLPQWPYVSPFCMETGSDYRPGGPPALDSFAYRKAFREVFAFGSVNSVVRTPEQTEIAKFWADGAGTATPPGHWNEIAQTVAETQGNSLVENARLFALLDLALADAAISSWDAKYTYDLWRPVTAIRYEMDPNWLPLIVTPPFPSYTSGHSTFSSSAARVLGSFFGTDDISFSTTSDGLPGVTRTFSSFWQAAQEAGQSRIYGGIHWQFDNQDALAAGGALGRSVAKHFLTPIDGNPLTFRHVNLYQPPRTDILPSGEMKPVTDCESSKSPTPAGVTDNQLAEAIQTDVASISTAPSARRKSRTYFDQTVQHQRTHIEPIGSLGIPGISQ